MCRENASVINGIGFALLIVASILCTLSFSSPFWVYYPDRFGVPEIKEQFGLIDPEYPFEKASWRGLWAVCFKEPNFLGVADSNIVSLCAWFWQKDFSLWKTIPNWYLATEGMFTVAIILLFVALVVETLFACCHCCLRRSCAPMSVASFTVAAALMCVTSLALYAGYSVNEGEIKPEPNGQGGQLDWAFYVGIGGAAAGLVSAVLFYCDGCRLAKLYSHYKPPSVAVS